jgi:hypothetical protein
MEFGDDRATGFRGRHPAKSNPATGTVRVPKSMAHARYLYLFINKSSLEFGYGLI